MYIYIYLHIFTYIYIDLHIFTYIYTYIYLFTIIYIYIYTYLHIYIHIYTCFNDCFVIIHAVIIYTATWCVTVCVCLHAYMGTDIYIYPHLEMGDSQSLACKPHKLGFTSSAVQVEFDTVNCEDATDQLLLYKPPGIDEEKDHPPRKWA